MTANVDIEAAQGRCDENVERLTSRREGPCDLLRDLRRGLQGGREDRAGVDGDDLMRAGLHEADLGATRVLVARMKRGAPAPFAMRADQRIDRRCQVGMPQSVDQQSTFPVSI